MKYWVGAVDWPPAPVAVCTRASCSSTAVARRPSSSRGGHRALDRPVGPLRRPGDGTRRPHAPGFPGEHRHHVRRTRRYATAHENSIEGPLGRTTSLTQRRSPIPKRGERRSAGRSSAPTASQAAALVTRRTEARGGDRCQPSRGRRQRQGDVIGLRHRRGVGARQEATWLDQLSCTITGGGWPCLCPPSFRERTDSCHPRGHEPTCPFPTRSTWASPPTTPRIPTPPSGHRAAPSSDGAPNVLLVCSTTWASAPRALRGPVRHAHGRAAGRRRPRLHPLPHHGPLCAHRAALLTGRNHHSVGMGASRPGHLGPGLQLDAAQGGGAAGRDPRLNGYSTAQFGKCHEVPMWENSPVGAVRPVADRQWLRALLRLHRRRHQPVVSRSLRGDHARSSRPDARRGLPPDRGPGRPGHRLDAPAEDPGPDKPFFAYFAPGATHAPHHAPKEWIDRYRGRFDGGWDALRNETFARQKALGVIPADAELTERPAEIPAWDDIDDEAQAGAGPSDGGLRRIPLPHRPPRGPADRRPRGAGDPRRHAGALPHRRQRGECGGHSARNLQRAVGLQPEHGLGDHRVPEGPHRRVRHPGSQQPLCRRLGARHLYPLPVDQAGGVPFRWDPQRDGRPLAGRIRSQGRDPLPVPPRHRHRPHHPGGGGHPSADVRQRHPADAPARGEHALLLRRCGRTRAPRDPILRDRLQPGDLPQGLDGGHPPQHSVAGGRDCRHSTTTPGSSTTPPATGPRPTIWLPNIPRSSATSSACSSSRRSSMAPSRWTTVGWSGSWPRWPAGPS